MVDLGAMRRRAFSALTPPPQMALSTWIEAEVRLPEGLCACPGPMRLYPYQREIADCIGNPEIERVTLQKAARIGFSALLAAAIGNYCINDPSPILAVQPTQDDCRDFVVSDLEPMWKASPALAGIFGDEARTGQRGKTRNTVLSRQFPGGSLKIVPSKSPRNLRRHTARILAIDEADAMPDGPEGSPIELVTKRTLTFSDRKIILGSTPIDEETSNVCEAYAASDMRIFEVPCPACGTFAEILWRHIEWQPGRPETAAYRCEACNALVDESHKPVMVEAGRWRATAPDVKGHAGFRLNALVSLLHNARWSVLAAEFLKAKDSPELLQVFVNTALAEPWRNTGDEIDETGLLGRGEDFSLAKIPEAVLAITAGADIQQDRIELSICGWSRDGTCFVLAHFVLWGPTDQEPVWQDLSDHLQMRWQHPLGGVISIDAAAIDAGSGSHYDKVLKFAAARAAKRVFAVKGAPGFSRPHFKASTTGKVRGGQRLFIVGVDGIKLLIFQRLKRGQINKIFSNRRSDLFRGYSK